MLKVSVIIATYNRAELLKRVLDCFLKQEIESSFLYELLVVDNNSKDNTKEIVISYIPKFASDDLKGRCLGLKYIFESQQGKPYALNQGIKSARGEYILFTDDDVIVEPKWLSAIMKCFDDHDCDGVGGRVLPLYPQNSPEWIKKNENKMAGVVVIYDSGNHDRKYDKSMEKFIGANYAFKKSVFDECGLFRSEFSPVGEDREFIRRLVKHNKLMYYCGQAVIWHPVDLERIRLKNIIRWNLAVGKSVALRENESRQSEKYVYWFGIPRHLIKGVVLDIFLIIFNVFRRRSLFYRLRNLFRKVGMILRYKSFIRMNITKE